MVFRAIQFNLGQLQQLAGKASGSALPTAVIAGGGGGPIVNRTGEDTSGEYETWEAWIARLESYGKPGSLRWYVNTSRRVVPNIPSGSALAARFRSTVGPDFGKALELGAGISSTTTQLPIKSPVASVALAAVGFLGGLVLGLIPFERLEAEQRWRSFCGTMSPIERMATLVSIRPLVERAFAADNIALPAGESFNWRYTDDVVHTLWSGRVASINGLVEILFASGKVVPDEFASDPRLRLWLLAYAFGYADGNTAVGQTYAIPHSTTVNSLRANIAINNGLQLVQAFELRDDVDLSRAPRHPGTRRILPTPETVRTVAMLRVDCVKQGIRSIYNPMLPKALRESVGTV